MRALPVLAVALLAVLPPVLSGCGGQAACEVPAGCLRAERTGGSCSCAEWEVVDTQSVALPYVVTGLDYEPFGANSIFLLGQTWMPALERHTETSWGTNVRVVIRSVDGGEQVARVGTIDEWTGIEPITPTVVRTMGAMLGVGPALLDISDPGTDFIGLWINPAVTVDTTAAGEKVVHWSVGSAPVPDVPGPFQHVGFRVRTLQAGTLGTGWVDAYLAALGPEGRAAILAFDERLAGPPMSERYRFLDADVLSDGQQTSALYHWSPCDDPGAFEVLAETAVPLANGDTFVLQYGAQADATCSPQSPGMYLEMTRGCETGYQMFVDRLSGRLMMLAAPYGTCTGR